jgi:peptidoglycan/LPS O-acetylase OafA/YrhL
MSAAPRLSSLDALRGIAALLVVWQHTSESFARIPTISENGTLLFDLAHQIDFGRIGVISFFLISGFVIPYSLKENSENALKGFAIKRFFRLYPIYWISIFMALGIDYLFQKDISISQILSNLTMLQTFLGEKHIQGLFWSLQIELIFYLSCALLFHFKKLRHTPTLIFSCSFFFVLFITLQLIKSKIPVIANLEKELLYMPYILSIMFLGSLLKKNFDEQFQNKKLKLQTALLSTALFGFPCAVFALSLLGKTLVDGPFTFFISHIIGFALFLFFLFKIKNTPKFLITLGAISYSLYLFHPIFMNGIIWLTQKNTIPNNLPLSIYMISTLILCSIFSYFVFKFVETPCINLSRKLTKKV